MEFNLMDRYKWTYNELLETPFHVIASLGFIKSSIAAHDKLKELKGKEKNVDKR